MPLCAKCQREAPEGALFCPFCSTAIVPPQEEGEVVDPLIGKTIKGTYLVQQKIGGGGMGQVYKAVQISLDRPVALKLLRPSFLSDPTLVQRFHREARASSKLHHPNIIAVVDFGQIEDGTLFMAMEYLPGRNLLKLMREEFPIGEDRVVNLAAQVLSALAEAHRTGIVHRDLKPENVMVESRPDEPDFVKVLDFGIAQINEPSDSGGRLTQAGVVCGTPDYMSPEQAALLPLDARSDLYSMGIMLYEMLAGRHPFQANTPPAMVQAHVVQTPPPMATRCPPGRRVTPALEALVMRALAKQPENRFQSAEEMRWELLSCPLDPELTSGAVIPQSGASSLSGVRIPGASGAVRTPSSPGSNRPRPTSPPQGTPRRQTPLHATTPATPRAAVTPRGRTPLSVSPAPITDTTSRPSSGHRIAAALTEPLLRTGTPVSSEPGRRETGAQPPRSRPRRRPFLLLAGVGLVGVAALAAAAYFFADRSLIQKLLHLPEPVPLASPEPAPTAAPIPPVPDSPPAPTPAPPAAAAAPPTLPMAAEPELKPAPSATVSPTPEAEGSSAVPGPSRPEASHKTSRTTGGKPVPPATKQRGRVSGSTRPGTTSRAEPEPTPAPAETPPAPIAAAAPPSRPPAAGEPAQPSPATTPAAQPSSAPAAAPSNRREAFVTREVLAFQQYFGNPELKERGRSLVTGSRWVLESDGSLTFNPNEKMGGVFPMTVRTNRDGNRIRFEGTRTARSGSGTAYVRINGNVAMTSSEPLLTVDLEIGRAQGADDAELEPTYRARSRLRLAPQ